MKQDSRGFALALVWLLPIWAAFLFVATLTRQPDPQLAFGDFASYVTTGRFLWSHLIGSIAGAAIGSIGVLGLMMYLQGSNAARRARTGMVATVAGNTILSSIFGVAAFAQPAMGQIFTEGQQNALAFYNQVYAAPLFGTALVGLLLFIVGGVFVGSAIAASARLTRWAGWVYAATLVGFALSNFPCLEGRARCRRCCLWQPSRLR